MKRILGYLKPYIGRMVMGFTIKFMGTIMDLFLPWILAYIIDNVVPTGNKNNIFLWGGAMILCALLAVTGNIAANRMASSVARDTTRRVRHDLFSKISYMSCSQVDKLSIPSLVSRMTSDTYNIHGMIGMMQRLGVRAPILLIGGIIITLSLDPVLTMVLVLLLPVLAVVIFTVSRKGIPLYSKHQQSVDQLVRKVRENITGVRVIKALSRSDYEKEAFADINKQVVKRETKAAMVMAITNPTMNFILNLGWVTIIIVGAYRVNAGLCKVGTIVAFLTYFTIILNSLMMITRLFMMFSKAYASAMRIDEVMSQTEDLKVLENKYPPSGEADYHIEFKNVSFSYNGVKNNLENISFKIKRGESLGIIGATGAGKSTIIRLLMRLYDIEEGEILINGINIKEIDKGILRKMFGVVFQNDTIFEDTVYENISLGRDIPLKTIDKAAEYANIKEHIENMESGYDSAVAIRGANLSGGQKQRVLIARALAGNPQILILDDSSSALDYKTDSMVRHAIEKNYKQTTSIVIAQRVSAVKNLTQIIVLDNGHIIGMGTHDELMESCEIYREIGESQMGGDMDA
ncbi:MAG: ABC transporter ATP-binding protein [Lachnospiraceae bacterium]